MPTSSSPMFSMLVLIPTALKIMSASRTSSPFLVFTVAFTPFPEVSTEVTSAEVIILMPLFLKERSNCLEISSSSTGTIPGKYSTIVTSVPIEL